MFQIPGYCTLRDSINNNHDTLYYKRYADHIVIKLDIENDFREFKLINNEYKLDLRPNLGPAKLLSFNYRWAYLSFSYLPRIWDKNKWNEQRGETSGYGISFGMLKNKWLADIGYKEVKGYYLHNTGDFEPNWNPSTDDYIQFPDLESWIVRGNILYKFNPNYSIQSIKTQTEAQRKSAASLIPGINYSYYVIDNNSTTATSTQRSETLQLLAQLNYYATLVLHKRWYVAGGIGVAGGGYYSWLLTRFNNGDNWKSTYSNFIARGKLNTGIGYNSDRFIAGAEFIYYKSFSNQSTNEVKMEFTRIAYQVFIGYRIKAPKWVDKVFDAPSKIL